MKGSSETSEPDFTKPPVGGKEMSDAPILLPAISISSLRSLWVTPSSMLGMILPITSSVSLPTFLSSSISAGSLIIRR